MTPESKYYQSIKSTLPRQWMLQRIETTTANGVPDLNVLIPNLGELWIELKSTKSTVRLRKEQYAWLTKRMLMNGIALVFVEKNKQNLIWHKPFKVEPCKNPYVKITTPPDAILKNPDLTDFLIDLVKTKKNTNCDE